MVVRVRSFIRGVLSGCDGVDFHRGVPSGWVEMNFDDDAEGSDEERSEPEEQRS